jgi:hypothetical protein
MLDPNTLQVVVAGAIVVFGGYQAAMAWVRWRHDQYVEADSQRRYEIATQERKEHSLEVGQRHVEAMQALKDQRELSQRQHMEAVSALSGRHVEAIQALGDQREDNRQHHKEMMESLRGVNQSVLALPDSFLQEIEKQVEHIMRSEQQESV